MLQTQQVLLLSYFIPFLVVRVVYHPWDSEAERGRVRLLEGAGKLVWMSIALTTMLSVLVLWLLMPSSVAWAQVQVPVFVVVLGWILGLASTGLLWWSHQTLGRNYHPMLHVDADQRLVTTGPYQRVRHPIYTALAGVCLAIGLSSGNVLIGMSWIVGVGGTIATRIRREDQLMRDRFGAEHVDWTGRTGWLTPWT